MVLSMLLGIVAVQYSDAAKPYEGTTVKVIVNAEYVKYAMTLVEQELFDKHGIKLEVEVIPGEAFVTKTLLEFTSGRSPWDLIMFTPTYMADYFRHFEPLEPFIKKLNLQLELDDIAKEYQISNMYWGGTLYAMPLDGDIHTMFYTKVAFERPENKPKFKAKYGYDLAPPQTWKQWDDQAAFFTGWGWDGSDQKLFGAGASYKENNFSFHWWRQRFFAYGGQYFDENMKPLVNTAAGVRALDEMVRTMPYYPPGVMLFESEEPKTLLVKGEIPLLHSWTSTGKRVGNPAESVIVGKAGFGLVPGAEIDGKIIHRPAITPGRGMAVSKYSKKKEVTMKVLEFISLPDQSLKIVMDAKTIMDPWRVSHLRSEKFKKLFPDADKYLAAIEQTFPYLVPDPVIPAADEYQRKLAFEITEALAKRKAPKDALDSAAREWDKVTERRGLEKQKAAWGEKLAEMKQIGIEYQPDWAAKAK